MEWTSGRTGHLAIFHPKCLCRRPAMLLPTITELDRQILSSPPFVHVEGVINIRALGGYRITDSHFVKPSIIFRSGDPSKITADGKEQLRALGVTKFFDLRDESEIVNYGSRMPAIDGIEFVRVPIPAHGGTDAESMRDRSVDCSNDLILHEF